MTKSIAVLLLTGCSIATVERAPVDSPRGEVEFKVVRQAHPETLAGGYSLSLVKDGRFVASRDCDPRGPVALEDLEPGRYKAVLRGEHLKCCDFEFRVRAGERTSIVVLHRNVLNRERAEEIASTAGTVIVYTVGIPVYGVAWLTVECCTHWGDGDVTCDASSFFSSHPSHPGRPAPPQERPRFKNYKKP